MIGVKRSPESPAILAQGKAKGRYRGKEVFDWLAEDFHDKCNTLFKSVCSMVGDERYAYNSAMGGEQPAYIHLQ